VLAKAENLLFEVEDNYQKQTYRTRCYIYGANGKQLLSIPVKNANSTQQTKEVLIDNTYSWQKQHIKAIASAYRSSPFHEFYEDEINEVFNSNTKYLLDFNLKCQEVLLELLPIDKPFGLTKTFEKKVEADFRLLADSKMQVNYNFEPYTQVFSDKHGFIQNLSILDLLFMEGPNALNYLEQQTLDLL
tara:strand:+ start:15564 stop:16127 length:564 start_codon:yes stop_codon:yes gene_type:complete